MQALWLEGGRLAYRPDQPPPSPGPGEALVRVLLAGVCNTDLEMVKGYYPFTGIPGHEFVGRVEAAPSAPEWVGRRVVGEINVVCGTCAACRAGRRTHCERRTVLGIRGRHGAFAEGLLLPVENLHAVPDGVEDEAACFAEPLAAALQVQEQVTLQPDDRVVVIGAGKLGRLVALSLRLKVDDVLVVGRDEARLASLQAAGLRTAVSAAGVPGLPDGRADVVVECTGNPEGLALAARLVRPRGTIVMKSTYHGEARLDVSRLVVNEVTLLGSRCGPFPRALEVLAAGGIDAPALVHARYPLREGLRAFEKAARPGVLKVLLDCG
jgi:threonine dehydrogenase-like Zn-dependent dehydrogenase